MFLSTFTGIMARRLLVNWRIDPEAAGRILPPGVRPKLVEGFAIAGLCLVRLEQLRPGGLPAWLGLPSENVAARMGVEWDEPGGVRKAVLIFRRDTASLINGIAAQRVGYGVHHMAKFRVKEHTTRADIGMESKDQSHHLAVSVHDAATIPHDSVFQSMSQAVEYFRSGECGFSPGRSPGVWEGASLHMHRWDLIPMHVDGARSSFINSFFGPSAVLDSAFIMRDIEHTWSRCGNVRFGLPGVSNNFLQLQAA